MGLKKIAAVCLVLACVSRTTAQKASQSGNKFVRLLQKTVWIAGLSGTVIDDDAKQFKDLFNIKDSWDFLYYPSKVNLEGYIDKGFSIEGSFTYSRLQKGKILGENKATRAANLNLIAFDVNGKYDLMRLFGEAKTLNPYMIAGFGYTRRNAPERKTAITANIGFGLNVWVYKGFGVNVQSHAKFALNNAYGRNYLQHSVGIVYRFNLLTGYKTPDRLRPRYNLFKNLDDHKIRNKF
jgi:hypothetical protein